MTPSGLQEATTKEQYDSLGRLRSVAERSGPSGSPGALPPTAEVTTTYDYDAADRLRSVFMSDPTSGKSQTRTFEYDGRGFLLREVPVESSPITYSMFDARGHAGERSVGAAASLFDLKYEFDAAERVTKLSGRNPDYTATNGQDAFRLMKEFSYCTISTGSNYCQGKLGSATRYNYRVSPSQPFEHEARGTLLVKEDYVYGDLAGRLTNRKTTISSISPFSGLPVAMREIDQPVTYNDLGLISTLDYPMCLDCGMPSGNPARGIQPTYTGGRITSLFPYATDLKYAPAGPLESIKHSAGSIVDTYLRDDSGMARPKSITFGRVTAMASAGGFYGECVPPGIQAQPANQTMASGQTATLSVTATGSGPISYQWYSYNVSTGATSAIAGATSSSITVSPTSTSGYFVRATNVCRHADSNLATITISGSCKTPSINSISDGRTSTTASTMSVTAGAGSSLTLSVIATGSDPLAYQWSRVTPQAQTLGTTAAVAVSIASTSQYRVTVSNGCGSVTGTFNVTVGLAPPASLIAARSGTNAITVSWQPSAGASTYVVQRRSSVTGFEDVASVTTTQYVDSGRPTGSSHVYRVRALDSSGGSASSPSSADVGSTLTFTPMSTGMLVSSQPLGELLGGLNALRVVAGWNIVDWSQILPAGLPPPASGSPILAAHIAALRNEFNQVLSAVGASNGGFTDPQLANSVIRATHITELQQRGQ